MKSITASPAETYALGKKIAAGLSGGEVLALFGELGAGKTTFIRGVVNYFFPGKRVISPTYIIVRHYQIKGNQIKNLIHADLYRLDQKAEIVNLGIQDFFNNKDSVVLIEWAEKAQPILPKKRVDIRFTIIADNKREIKIKKA